MTQRKAHGDRMQCMTHCVDLSRYGQNWVVAVKPLETGTSHIVAQAQAMLRSVKGISRVRGARGSKPEHVVSSRSRGRSPAR